jgi:hypothetical protein
MFKVSIQWKCEAGTVKAETVTTFESETYHNTLSHYYREMSWTDEVTLTIV